MKAYIGIDIGGTAVKGGILTEEGTILESRTQKLPLLRSGEDMIHLAMTMGHELIAKAAAMSLELQGGGVSATGQIDPIKGQVIGTCGNIEGWSNQPIRDRLSAGLGLPLLVENDVNCALKAEHWLGVAKGKKDIIMYTIGTGIGGALMMEGRVIKGHLGIAGEIGHMVVAQGGRGCTCGQKGCFEAYGSMTALVHEVQVAKDLDFVPDGLDLYRMMEEGDGVVRGILAGFYDIHSNAIASLVHLLNPELIVIGGGISAQGHRLIDPIKALVMNKAMPSFTTNLEILTAGLGNEAGFIGAVKYYLESVG